MKISRDIMLDALNENKIIPYEEELISRLRYINFQGIPISITVLCKEACRGECYVTSVNLTRGMDYFKLVHGDVNFIKENDSYPNHSWVEKDGFVYDPTDGFKWDKEFYYSLFNPKVREVYDEKTVKDYKYYQDVLRGSDISVELSSQALMIQYIELLELENPYVNKDYLLNEIEIWRKNNNIVEKFSDEVMKQYRKLMNEMEKD